jgi:hypothetical protein
VTVRQSATALDTVQTWAASIRDAERERVLAHVDADLQDWIDTMPGDVPARDIVASLWNLRERIKNGTRTPDSS